VFVVFDKRLCIILCYNYRLVKQSVKYLQVDYVYIIQNTDIDTVANVDSSQVDSDR
jgi:hypothetical protein